MPRGTNKETQLAKRGITHALPGLHEDRVAVLSLTLVRILNAEARGQGCDRHEIAEEHSSPSCSSTANCRWTTTAVRTQSHFILFGRNSRLFNDAVKLALEGVDGTDRCLRDRKISCQHTFRRAGSAAAARPGCRQGHPQRHTAYGRREQPAAASKVRHPPPPRARSSP
jgi:hypothetical protein